MRESREEKAERQRNGERDPEKRLAMKLARSRRRRERYYGQRVLHTESPVDPEPPMSSPPPKKEAKAEKKPKRGGS